MQHLRINTFLLTVFQFVSEIIADRPWKGFLVPINRNNQAETQSNIEVTSSLLCSNISEGQNTSVSCYYLLSFRNKSCIVGQLTCGFLKEFDRGSEMSKLS